MKKLYIKTYGCQMNVYDSERMRELLAPLGYEETLQAEHADLVILNTCHIRAKAAEKLYSDIGRLSKLRETSARGMLIAVGGCVAQAEGDEVMRRAPAVDMVFGPQAYHKLPQMLAGLEGGRSSGHRPLMTDFTPDEKFDSLSRHRHRSGVTAFVTVQEGCDKFCTFCVVPYTRGAEFSRPVSAVMAEVEDLVAGGVREVTLLGQNVNAYHGEHGGKSWSLGRLILALADIDGLQRIRYTTSHPRDMHAELLEAHAKVDKLMPLLHLPVQSGSDSILARMNRRHSCDDYLRIVDSLREARPDIALTSDFIVGFPSESNADFLDTLRLVRQVQYASAYSFKYSPRPGTPAAEAQQIPSEIANERLQTLQQLLTAQQQAFNHKQKNNVIPVLFEKQGRHKRQIVGRSPYLQPVHIECDNHTFLIGKIANCRINGVDSHSLFGEITENSSYKASA